jgi:hypothetical protein
MGSVFGCNFNHGRTAHVQLVTGGWSTHKRRASHLLTHLTPSLRAFRSLHGPQVDLFYGIAPPRPLIRSLLFQLETKLWEVRARH